VIIVGDSGVGKTSLLNRFCYSKFDPSLAPTIGTDFSTKIIKKNETTLRLQLWDVAGPFHKFFPIQSLLNFQAKRDLRL
jgi:small GTP-binding protein